MGLILPQEVEMKWVAQTRSHYLSLGYVEDGPSFWCKVQDLTHGSSALVEVRCDFCNSTYLKPYREVLNLRGDQYCCPTCLSHKKKTRDTNGNLMFIEIPYRNKDWLYHEYIELDREVSDIAHECGINKRTLLEWIKTFGLQKRDYRRSLIDVDDIVTRYRSGLETTEDIGMTYGVTGNTIASILRENGVIIPDRSDLMLQYYHKKGGLEKAREIAGKFENRVKSSCRQRGIPVEEFDGFSQEESHLIRNSWEYKAWRDAVFKRDDYRCVCCGRHHRRLEAHHLKNFSSYPEGRFDVDNGATLCVECHSPAYSDSFHAIYGEFNNTIEQFKDYIDTFSEQRKAMYQKGA